MPSLLIVHASCGSGHRRAAEAVAAAAAELSPGGGIVLEDVLDYLPGWYRRVYRDLPAALMRRLPGVYGRLYRWSDAASWRDPRPATVRAVDRVCAGGRYAAHLSAEPPDAVVATHFLPFEIGRRETPAICVVTDYRAHAFWAASGAALFAVPCEETARDLVARGVPAERIAVTGIPVGPGFAAASSTRDSRAAATPRHLLVLTGGTGWPLLRAFLERLDRHFSDLEITLNAGTSAALLRRMERAATGLRNSVRITGVVPDLDRAFASTDLLVTKPGGLVLAEAAVAGVPMILLPGLGGQEDRNARHFLERGAALHAANADEALAAFRRLRRSPALRRSLVRAQADLARPGAAAEVARRALALASGARGRMRR